MRRGDIVAQIFLLAREAMRTQAHEFMLHIFHEAHAVAAQKYVILFGAETHWSDIRTSAFTHPPTHASQSICPPFAAMLHTITSVVV